jgi:hypothetical protein
MKKQLLTLCLALLTASLFAAWSDTNTDTTRRTGSIKHFGGAATSLPTIDGVADDAIWAAVPAMPLDRPFAKTDTPTLYNALWKAFWTDTAIFVMVKYEDNSFWPSWKSGQADWASDKVETYYDVNGKVPDGYGASTGGTKGLYQVTNNFDTIPAAGVEHPGSFDSTFQANTWSYGDHAVITVEWLVSFKALKDSNGTGFDPSVTTQIGFDVCVSDLDSGGASRQRQMWSNVGIPSEDWNLMDSAGILTFSTEEIVSSKPIDANQTSLVQPTVVNDVINILGDNTNVEIYNTVGQMVMSSKNSNQVHVSSLQAGVYFVRVGTTTTKIIKK